MPKRHATTRRAVYTIWTTSGKVTRARNQKASRGRWVNLGAFDFGWWGTVRLTDKTGEKRRLRRMVAADAIRFVPIGPSAANVKTKIVQPSVKRATTTAPAPSGEVKLRLYPKELEAMVLARKTVSAWTCPAEDVSPFGPDTRPGTGDDACTAAVASWSFENEAAGRLNSLLVTRA